MQQQKINEAPFESHTSAEKDQHNSRLVSHEPIENTPFVITGDNNGYYLRIGNMKLTEHFKNEEEAFDYIITHQWELTLKLIIAVNEIHKNLTK